MIAGKVRENVWGFRGLGDTSSFLNNAYYSFFPFSENNPALKELGTYQGSLAGPNGGFVEDLANLFSYGDTNGLPLPPAPVPPTAPTALDQMLGNWDANTAITQAASQTRANTQQFFGDVASAIPPVAPGIGLLEFGGALLLIVLLLKS